MPRPSACRSSFILGLIFLLVVVQIALNILLSYCSQTAQDSHGVKREIHATSEVLRRSLTKQLRATQRTVAVLKSQLANTSKHEHNTSEIDRLKAENVRLASRLEKYEKLQKIVSAQEFSKHKAAASKLNFLKGGIVSNEFEVIPFDSFTHGAIFSVNSDGLVSRPGRRPIGPRVKEQDEILNFAVRVLKDEFPGQIKIERRNLVNGISRINRITGTEYDLTFATGRPNEYRRVKLRRPFSNIELVGSVDTIDTSKEIINLILPLSGRTDNFKIFLKRFGDICVRWDGRVYLTVVYFGTKDRDVVNSLLSEFEDREKFKNYKVIFEDGPFSRGAGLQRGVLSWEKGNNIMFFCDVDMFFMPDFLERCRFYTEPGQMLYYPMVFSLYNPEVVYNGRPPEIYQQLYIGKDNGFWRDFGFGMTCVYKNDFVETKGFDTSIHGWGTEDLKLYRKFLQTNLAVVRAVDRGIFHMYHPKKCQSSWPSEQYLSCLQSKAVTEASHREMGMLAFGNRLFSNFEPDWKTKLEYQPDFSLRDSKTKNKQAVRLWNRADELDIEVLEVKQLQNRLKAVMNFTVFGKHLVDTNKVNVSALRNLQLGLENITKVVRKFALAIGKNVTGHV